MGIKRKVAMKDSAGQNRSVLIIDDDKIILEILGTWFRQEGYACAPTVNASEGLAILEKNSYDLILVDIFLPDMNGLELMKKIKGLHPRARIIAMTGYPDDFSYDMAIEAGASDFLKKPFTLQELLTRIRIMGMQEDLMTWAITDELTGIYNRKGFFTLASHLLKLSKRTQERMFLLYADMDYLKEINDKYGHQEGDLALAEIARILKKNYRESDIVARIGGDEFVVFPVGSNGDSAETISARLEKVLASYNESSAARYSISLSWGTAVFDPSSPCSLDDLLIQGDKSMYEMKKNKEARS